MRRHRGKILTSVGIMATLFASGSVCIYLIKRWLYKQQLKITEQHFIREQIRRRFTQTQEDSLFALYELIPVFSMVLAKNLDLEELVIALRDKKLNKSLGQRSKKTPDNDGMSSGISTSITEMENSETNTAENKNDLVAQRTKAELWNELKVKSLVKMITICYTISSLLLLTRLQLNMLTRREYLETAIKVAVEKESSERQNGSLLNWIYGYWKPLKTVDKAGEETKSSKPSAVSKNAYINEQAFLSLSWWLLNRGWLEYQSVVRENVNKHFGNLNPRDKVTVQEFSDKLTSVFHDVNANLLNNNKNESLLKNILLPDPTLEDFVLQQTLDPEALKILNEDRTILRQLLHEATKCIESTASSIVLETLINESFQFVMEQLEKNVSKKKKSEEANDKDESYQIAVFTMSCKECCSDILKSGMVSMDNSFLSRLDSVVVLDDLSASVYSNFGFQD